MKATIRHTGRTVPDIAKSINFYESLGFKLVSLSLENWPWENEWRKIKVAKLVDEKKQCIELIQGNWPDHIALTVDEIPMNIEVLTSKEGDGLAIVYAWDPDGNIIEFVRRI